MKKTLKDFNFDKKVVILRCDFNVSYQKGKIIDDTKLVESIPTIKYLFEHNAKVIILSHFGKVKEETGKLTGNEELEIKGKIQQGVGKAREVVEDVKDNVLDKANDIVDDMTDKE